MNKLTATTLTALVLISPLARADAAALTLVDPTRPPGTFVARVGAAGALDGADAPPRLQSVLISRRAGGRHVAVINGETVRLGEHYKGARVTRMTQTQIELMRGRERQVLHLDGPPGTAVAANPTHVN